MPTSTGQGAMTGLLLCAVACGGGEATGDLVDAGTGSDGQGPDAGRDAPRFMAPRTGLSADEVAVLVNDADPLSVQIAAAYVAARGVPAGNVVHLTLPTSTAERLTEAEFTPLRAQVEAALASSSAQALLLTWTRPYAVDNMSITSAFSFGYRAIDGADTCYDPDGRFLTPTPYAAMPSSTQPMTDFGVRPAMMLAATSVEDAEALIARGVAADDTWPTGTIYLMNTSDTIRSARCRDDAMYGWVDECAALVAAWDAAGSGLATERVAADAITGETDVFVYVQGLSSVGELATNTYLPGAIADHLTSFGGQVPTSSQMSAIEFLRAGATGSYGTVVEPCAWQEKFPDPAVLVPAYFAGATLIEAYWRSVDWPAQGLFLGEPLARPFGTGFRSSFDGTSLTIEATALHPGQTYLIEAADTEAGPFSPVLENLSVATYRRSTFVIPVADRAVYRLREAD